MPVNVRTLGRPLLALLALMLFIACTPFREPSWPEDPYTPSEPQPVPFESPLDYRQPPMQVAVTGAPFRTLAVNALRERAPTVETDGVGASFFPDLTADEWAQALAFGSVRLIDDLAAITPLDERLLGAEAVEALRTLDFAAEAAILYMPGVLTGSQDAYITQIYSSVFGEPPPDADQGWTDDYIVVYGVHRVWTEGPAHLSLPFHLVAVARDALPPAALQYDDLIRLKTIYTSGDKR